MFVVMMFAGCASQQTMPPLPLPTVSNPRTTNPVAPRAPAAVAVDVVALARRGEFADSMKLLESLGWDGRHEAVRVIMDKLLAADLDRAAQFATELPEGSLQVEAAAAVAPQLAARQLAAGVNWVLQLPSAGTRVAALRSVSDWLLATRAVAPFDPLVALAVPERREELLSIAAARWARRDLDAAWAWAEGLAPDEIRNRALTSIAFEVAQTSPQRAVHLASALPANRERWLLLGTIGRTWVASDAAAAWDWARSLPAGAAREAAISGIEAGLGVNGSAAPRSAEDLRLRSENTPVFAGAGRAPSREETLRREFEQRLLASPVQAADWLSSLPAPDRKDEMIERLAREWLAINPQAATRWLEQNVPSDAWRRHLLDQANATRR